MENQKLKAGIYFSLFIGACYLMITSDSKRSKTDYISGGMGKGLTDKDVDPKELRMGIKVEMEHTKNRAIAKKIALDHLAEKSNYYSLLKTLDL